MGDARDKLAVTVDRIYEDGVMDEAEKAELKQLFIDGGLTVTDVREVMKAFVHKTWGEVIEDGIVDADERAKLSNIVEQLSLPADCVPEEVAAAISG